MIKREEGEPEPPAALNEAVMFDAEDEAVMIDAEDEAVMINAEEEDDMMISQMTQHLEPEPSGSVESPMTMVLNLYL